MMNSPMLFKVCILALSLAAGLQSILGGCTTTASSGRRQETARVRAAEPMDADKTLIGLVRKFANDEGPHGEAAWEQLRRYPRQDSINSLKRIQEAVPEHDTLRVDIAFVFCNLDYKYQFNRQTVVTAFAKRGQHGLGEERLISRLVRRGDSDLLHVLFSAAERSDGALSEGLSDTFAEQILGDPEKFLLKLKSEPLETRRKVYELLDETVMTEDDVRKVKTYLRSVPRDAAIAPVASEMIVSLPIQPPRQ